MPYNNLLYDEPSWLTAGPGLALGLFLVLAVYAALLLAATTSANLPLARWLNRRTIYRDLVTGLALLATVPAIALALVLTSRAANQREERAMDMVHETTSNVAARVDQFFEKHQTGIASLAASIERAGRMDARSLTEWLESHHSLYPDYLTMLAADSTGEIVTATAMVHGHADRIVTINHNISDRTYFREPIRNGGQFVSEVFEGRGLGNDPIVAISSLVRDGTGNAWGIVEGSVDLKQLSRFRPSRKTLGQDASLLILDNQDRVVFSSDPARYRLRPSFPSSNRPWVGKS